jgi:hypothetical protein
MEGSVKQLIKIARRVLCYVPRAYENEGPHGELEDAIKDVESFLDNKIKPEDPIKSA